MNRPLWPVESSSAQVHGHRLRLLALSRVIDRWSAPPLQRRDSGLSHTAPSCGLQRPPKMPPTRHSVCGGMLARDTTIRSAATLNALSRSRPPEPRLRGPGISLMPTWQPWRAQIDIERSRTCSIAKGVRKSSDSRALGGLISVQKFWREPIHWVRQPPVSGTTHLRELESANSGTRFASPTNPPRHGTGAQFPPLDPNPDAFHITRAPPQRSPPSRRAPGT